MDKDKLILKKRMQEARNIIKTIHGIIVVKIYEPDEGIISKIDYEKMGVYNSTKKPDEIIDLDVSEQWICDFIIRRTKVSKGAHIQLLLSNGIWTNVEITDVESFLMSVFLGNHSITFMDNDYKLMYELGTDSRDEYHLLYDEYIVVFN